MSGKNGDETVKKLTVVLFMVSLILLIAVGALLIINALGSKGNEDVVPVIAAKVEQTATAERTTDSGSADETRTGFETDHDPKTEPMTEEVTESETNDPNADKYDEIIAGMTLHEKICQMFIVTPEQLTGYNIVTYADDLVYSSLEQYPVAGMVLFAQNLEGTYQTQQLISECKAYAEEIGSIPLIFGVDEEGGNVARCAYKLGTTAFDPMYYYREYGTDRAYDNAYTIGSDIASLGFDLDFAPIADTWSNYNNTVIGTRAYSDDFDQTAELVGAAVQGFHGAGVLCTLKHFPGHGDTAEDSHYGSAYSNKTLDELRRNEFLAFESGIKSGAELVMVGHITMNGIDGLPATLSYTLITGELRGDLGFEGVVITDSLSMGAVANNYASGELAVRAVKAGNDILLMPYSLAGAVSGLENAVLSGEISEERIDESVRRILIMKDKL